LNEETLEQEIANAKAAWLEADQTELRAESVMFNESDNSITINLRNGAKFICPCHLIQGLQEASLDDLADVYISAAGNSIHWDTLDIDMGIPELITGIFGTKAWMAELPLFNHSKQKKR
jgi:hypothetical protein